MAGFTASWVHGNAVVMEQPAVEDGGVFSFNYKGWGTQICMRPGFSRWFHIPIPTPVILDGSRLKLIRAFLQIKQVAGSGPFGIDDVHLYDGGAKIAAQSAHDFVAYPAASLPDTRVFELYRPRVWGYGLGISFLLSGVGYWRGAFVDNQNAPWICIYTAGADFEPS